ncbi:MAG: glycosyltransferase [Gammaproteobacteria bacterium]|nr:glycosyltransferase [Gammaproteobacteria bacterium]
MRIAHIITGLDTGGTELFLEHLVEAMDSAGFESLIISLTGLGTVGHRMQSHGRLVQAVGAGWNPRDFFNLFGLRRILRHYHPALIQGWMYHANLAASLAGYPSGKRRPVIWNIRHSLDQWTRETAGLRMVVRMGGLFSGTADCIVFNSQCAALQHERTGYPRSKAVVIHNGFDLQKFRPAETIRASMRSQHGIPPDGIVFGTFSRFHPLKDHANLLRAAAIVANKHHDAIFLLAGRGVSSGNQQLMDQVRMLHLENRVILLGERSDIWDVMNAVDIYVCPSSSEAFPNSVGEAMCCGVPCVVTDVGDSALLVAETGIVVPPSSPERLASGMLQMIQSGPATRTSLGSAARLRMTQNFSKETVVQRYAELYSAHAS